MHILNRFSSLLVMLSLLAVCGTGCLKDEMYEDQKTNIQVDKNIKVIEIRGPIIGSYGQVLNFSTADTTVDLVTINLASDEPAPEDITVTLALDPTVVDDYNEAMDENFTILPASAYQFQTFEVTIPRGQREAVLNAKVLNPSFLESGKYALGVKLVSVSNPSYRLSGNYGKQVIAMRVKNKYHGTYHAVGVFNHPVAGPRDIDEDKELITEEPNSVRAPLGDLGSAGYEMILVVNADNSVTIKPFGATPNIDQKWGPSFYNPETKAFHLHYSYNAAAPRIIQEVITLK